MKSLRNFLIANAAGSLDYLIDSFLGINTLQSYNSLSDGEPAMCSESVGCDMIPNGTQSSYYINIFCALRHQNAMFEQHRGADRIFIDIGCGSGRAVIASLLFSFKESYGIELAPAAYDESTRNIATARLPKSLLAKATFLNTEGISWVLEFLRLRGENVVVYMFNPFNPEAMKYLLTHPIVQEKKPTFIITNPYLGAPADELFSRYELCGIHRRVIVGIP